MCVFCAIVNGTERASVIHHDDLCLAFMNIRPINPGEFMVIPRAHIDHFTDLPDDLASHILRVAQRFGRKLRQEVDAVRIGYVVHGFGVPHAHLNVVPLTRSDDIISAKHVHIEGKDIRISVAGLAMPTRDDLDRMAARLAFAR
jgi:histidine triad (HIT) family protein